MYEPAGSSIRQPTGKGTKRNLPGTLAAISGQSLLPAKLRSCLLWEENLSMQEGAQ
ncbi:MAG: hypothetical protein QNJ78_15765 [Gammaproteobacteria bacterium]|nr:hypothetical protein [Gammaproteobacteria bacterium]